MWRQDAPRKKYFKEILLREFARRVVSGNTRGGGINCSHGDRCEGWFSDPHSEIKVWRTQGFRSGVRDWLVLEGYSDKESKNGGWWEEYSDGWGGRGGSKYCREMDKNTRRRWDEKITYVLKCKIKRILCFHSKYLAKKINSCPQYF